MGLGNLFAMKRTPSLDDFSCGASSDVESMERERYGRTSAPVDAVTSMRKDSLDSQRSSSESASPRFNVWQEIFNPGRNFSKKMQGKDSIIDSVSKDGPSRTTWEYVEQSQRSKDAAAEDAAAKHTKMDYYDFTAQMKRDSASGHHR